MIDFRYHLVSIVAVFLALAVGIVLGSTELRGAAFSALDRTSNALSTKLEAADNQNSALQQQVQGDHQFAEAAEPVLLKHLLDSKRVVIVTTPGAPSSVVNGIKTGLSDAGATVSGQVALSSKFADTSASNLSLLDQLTQQATPSGMTLTNGSPQQQAAQVLAAALVSKDADSGSGGNKAGNNSGTGNSGNGSNSGNGNGNGSISSQDAQTIVSSFSAGQFISVSGHPTSGATLAVIVTPATAPQDGNSDPVNQAVVALAQEFGQASQATVVTGPSAGSGTGSAISAVRSSGAANNAATVDNADSVVGQIVAVQALEQQMNGHKPGSFGTQSNANSAGPSPAPTPSASSSPPQKNSSKGK